MKRFLQVVLILLILIVGGASYAAYEFTSDTAITADTAVTIDEGSSSSAIGYKLEEAGLVKDATVFKYYARVKEVDQQFQAGEYVFPAGTWSLGKVCDVLIAGTGSGDDVQVTIIEGLKAEEIFQTLADAGFGSVENYMVYAENGDFSEYPYIPAQSDVAAPGNRLNGFLFPDTYMISKDATETEIIDKLLAQFDYVWTSNGLDVAAEESDYSVYELVTMASVVEMESRVDDERPVIAGVFYKRLDNGIPLESCATVQFLLEEKRSILLFSDLEIDSPYNTYMYAGLPAAPICSPGLASLQAAVAPAETDYWYFRARTDGSNRFSETLEEHNTYHDGDQTE